MNGKQFKKNGKEISDYSWMAPNDDMSCWEKAQLLYNGTFEGKCERGKSGLNSSIVEICQCSRVE
jgi:hypothetical protein